MNTYKYKEAGNGWHIKTTIDKNGIEIKSPSFNQKNSPGLFAEMQTWEKIKGNVIEPQITESEQAVIDQEAKEQAIETTKSLCIKYLDESEKHVTDDPPYPGDTQAWKDSRAEWRTILKSGKAQSVPDKPFGG